MDYNFKEIEPKWQACWDEKKIYKTLDQSDNPKYYVLDMFPYPSGAGLHVGHPLGYISSDIYTRYKRLKGYNVLHPMGFDAFGLPAEQYAIQTGQHPAVTTEINVKRYRKQLDRLGFSFDWEREILTSDPQYYKWTQWTFIQLFHHYYDTKQNKALPISELVSHFSLQGTKGLLAAGSEDHISFTAEEWKAYSEKEQQECIMNYRLAYLADTYVNWCPALGTVLANDEVVNGVSERGGHPVERKLMRQWFLRVSAYAERLLNDLDSIDWSDSLKEIQRNWIGRSVGASVHFNIQNSDKKLEIFTTRPDTLFGVTFMVLCPEHEWVQELTTESQCEKVNTYVHWAKNRSERERQSEVKKVTGVFTGSYVVHPLTGKTVPIWIADYVLAGYGTGAIMAVPGHDARDFAFARYFQLPVIQVVVPVGEQPEDTSLWTEAKDSKAGYCVNSDFISGKEVKNAMAMVIEKVEALGIGKAKVNYRLRDAIFSRQRYWGEPFPIYYKEGIPYTLDESELPLELPQVDSFLPTPDGEPPLARADNWKTKEGYPLETATMPGFAGSSGYYLRYMDPNNTQAYFNKDAVAYWKNVDLYMGGAEHASGHLIYARFWNKFLYDIGLSVMIEPFQKLINQGMIQGRTSFAYRIRGTQTYVSYNLKEQYETDSVRVDILIVDNDILDTEKFKQWRPELINAEFILEDGKYICGWEIEKMSKSYHNVQNPDDLVEKYGADTLRLYEMFLGPIEQAKPWDTKGIEGVFRFMKKVWRLYHDEANEWRVEEAEPSKEEWKVLYKTIQKVQDDIERFSFNTAISSMMICVNELSSFPCKKRAILEPFCILISSFAPHISEELWSLLGRKESVHQTRFPEFDTSLLLETSFSYPVSFNGKTRFTLELPIDISAADAEKAVLESPDAARWLEGKTPKKIIFVSRKIINIVI